MTKGETNQSKIIYSTVHTDINDIELNLSQILDETKIEK